MSNEFYESSHSEDDSRDLSHMDEQWSSQTNDDEGGNWGGTPVRYATFQINRDEALFIARHLTKIMVEIDAFMYFERCFNRSDYHLILDRYERLKVLTQTKLVSEEEVEAMTSEAKAAYGTDWSVERANRERMEESVSSATSEE